jgi:hypothetical protein
VIIAIVSVLVFALVIAVVVAVAKDPGPGPDDVAIAYERAWDQLDFETLYTLAGRELRDGLERDQYIAAKRTAYAQQRALAGLAARVGVDDSATAGNAAVVATRVELHDGEIVHNRVDLARRSSRWEVVGYRIAPTDSGVRGASGGADGGDTAPGSSTA